MKSSSTGIFLMRFSGFILIFGGVTDNPMISITSPEAPPEVSRRDEAAGFMLLTWLFFDGGSMVGVTDLNQQKHLAWWEIVFVCVWVLILFYVSPQEMLVKLNISFWGASCMCASGARCLMCCWDSWFHLIHSQLVVKQKQDPKRYWFQAPARERYGLPNPSNSRKYSLRESTYFITVWVGKNSGYSRRCSFWICFSGFSGFKYVLFSPQKLGKWSNLTFLDGWSNHQRIVCVLLDWSQIMNQRWRARYPRHPKPCHRKDANIRPIPLISQSLFSRLNCCG